MFTNEGYEWNRVCSSLMDFNIYIGHLFYVEHIRQKAQEIGLIVVDLGMRKYCVRQPAVVDSAG